MPGINLGQPSIVEILVIAQVLAALLQGPGVKGFEPLNVGTKIRCLTTWRHPNT